MIVVVLGPCLCRNGDVVFAQKVQDDASAIRARLNLGVTNVHHSFSILSPISLLYLYPSCISDQPLSPSCTKLGVFKTLRKKRAVRHAVQLLICEYFCFTTIPVINYGSTKTFIDEAGIGGSGHRRRQCRYRCSERPHARRGT